MELKDVKAIVTGAGSGMGAHFARRIVEGGGKVAAADVNEAGLGELPAAVFKKKVDVSAPGATAELAERDHDVAARLAPALVLERGDAPHDGRHGVLRLREDPLGRIASRRSPRVVQDGLEVARVIGHRGLEAT